jgi:hypothetical protein
MRITNVFVAVVSLLVLSTAAAWATEKTIITRGAVDRTVLAARDQNEAGRDHLLNVLRSEPVRRVARDHGLDPDRIEARASTLQGADLDRAVTQAEQVEQALAGGDNIVIGATTLIIILLVLLVILVAD